eukprot:8263935-Alexandrium_andersonii.AAC.1
MTPARIEAWTIGDLCPPPSMPTKLRVRCTWQSLHGAEGGRGAIAQGVASAFQVERPLRCGRRLLLPEKPKPTQ